MEEQLSAELQEMFGKAVALAQEGRAGEAEAFFRRILVGEPSRAACWHYLGNVLLAQGKADEAVAAQRTAIRLAPDSADAHNNLGAALERQRKLAEARTAFREALALEPRHFEAQFNFAKSLVDAGQLDDGMAELARARDLKHDHAPTHILLGFACLWQGRHAEAAAAFRDAAGLTQDHGRPIRSTTVSKARIRHDAEQGRYLLERGRLDGGEARYVEMLERLDRRAALEASPSWRHTVAPDEMAAIAPSFNRLLHLADCPRIPGGVVNPALDAAAIEARYHERKPELMYVDDLLTPVALQLLRRFCLESTIWKRDYPGGYLGAFISDGFACPLLIQVAEELRLAFPAIFRGHRLAQAWAFKYDNASQGLKIHADAAAVNVNFWITPDEVNLDPERGGLVVWDREAPAVWDFADYNNERKEPEVLEFLEQSGARAVTIPYRQNRAVIFNSNLFHCTDSFNFRDDYEARRVNITLLYGNRACGDPD